jgi:hypothetical protein
LIPLLLLQGKGNASTVEQLDALMHEIGSSKERYEKMLAWKHKKVRSTWQLPAPSGRGACRFQQACHNLAGLSVVEHVALQPFACGGRLAASLLRAARHHYSTLLPAAVSSCS